MEIAWYISFALTLIGFNIIMPNKKNELFNSMKIFGLILAFCGFITLILIDQILLIKPVKTSISKGEKFLFSHASEVNPFEADTIVILEVQHGYARFKTSFDYDLYELERTFDIKTSNHISSESVEYLLNHTIKIK